MLRLYEVEIATMNVSQDALEETFLPKTNLIGKAQNIYNKLYALSIRLWLRPF
jgi:hypothetical protein